MSHGSHVRRATCQVPRADVRRATCHVLRANVRRAACIIGAVATALMTIAGGGSPHQPGPPVIQPPPVIIPPTNNAPVIDSIAVQGTRRNEPANFADLSEVVDVTAQVRDDETPVAQLQYNWTATAGTFTGTGSRVSWQAPASATTPAAVTLTLEIVERYGTNQEHRVSKTAAVDLHNSAREVADLAVRFLTEFSKPQTNKDSRDIMRDFKAAACPQPGEVDAERNDVENHYQNFVMHNYRVDSPIVTINFSGSCPYAFKLGDACAAVSVMWDSTFLRDSTRKTTTGVDHISAAFSTTDKRWWLCSSYLQGTSSLGHAFYTR
jgi:hypothetical protein